MRSSRLGMRVFGLLLSALLVVSCKKQAGEQPSAAANHPPSLSLAADRAAHPTQLLKHGPAPQKYVQMNPPTGVTEVSYPSGSLKLRAWATNDPGDGRKR